MQFLGVCLVLVSLFNFFGTPYAIENYKWCGQKDVPTEHDDLGGDIEVDKCCRDHYLNGKVINGNTVDDGLYNPSLYRRYSCSSDGAFHTCLTMLHSDNADSIGNAYFNERATKCFMVQHPISSCLHFHHGPILKCMKYMVNRHLDQKLQWFDVPNY